MRFILALFLVAMPAMTLAQSHPQPSCWPAEAGGSGSPIVLRAGIAGLSYGWLCPATRRVHAVSGPWSAFIPTFEAEARRLAAGTDVDRSAAWTKYVTRTAALSAGVETLRLAVVADVNARYAR